MKALVAVLGVVLLANCALGEKSRHMKAQVYNGQNAEADELNYVVQLEVAARTTATCLGAIIKRDVAQDLADTILTSRECLVMLEFYKQQADTADNDYSPEIWACRIKPGGGGCSQPENERRRVGYHTNPKKYNDACFNANYNNFDADCTHLAVLHLAAPFTEPPTGNLGIRLGDTVPTTQAMVIGAVQQTMQENATDADGKLGNSPMFLASKAVTSIVDKTDATDRINNYLKAEVHTHPDDYRHEQYTDNNNNFWFTENTACDFDWGAIYVTHDDGAPMLVGIGTAGVCRISDANDAFQINNNNRDCVGQWYARTAAADENLGDRNIPEMGCGDPNSLNIVINVVRNTNMTWESSDTATYEPVVSCLNDVALLSFSERGAIGGATICSTLTTTQYDNEWNELHVHLPEGFELTTHTAVKRILGFSTQPDMIYRDTETNMVQLRWLTKPSFLDSTAKRFVFEIYNMRNPNMCCMGSPNFCTPEQLITVSTWNCPHTPLHGVEAVKVRTCAASTPTKLSVVANRVDTQAFAYPKECSLCNACYAWLELGPVSLWKCNHDGREYVKQGGAFRVGEPCFERGVDPATLPAM